ncbi:MAG: GLUG motif-containing protein [Thermoplasmatota archaeon]
MLIPLNEEVTSTADGLEKKMPHIFFDGGNGSIGDPFRISNVSQLQRINDNLSAHYLLVNDIDASETLHWNGGEGFDPIGEYDPQPHGESEPFEGTLRGSGHIIFDLYMDRTYTKGVGLISSLKVEGTVSNTHLIDCNITGESQVGGLVGLNNGHIENCSCTGSIYGLQDVGGLVGGTGYGSFGTVSNSFYSIDNTTINGKRVSLLHGIYYDQFSSWRRTGDELVIDDYLERLGGWYRISDLEDLKNMLPFTYSEGFRFRQTADIDLSAESGFSIPYFSSSEYDGRGFSLHDLDLIFDEGLYFGLFGYVSGSIIQNVSIIDFNVSGYKYVGAMVGYSLDSLIANCTMAGDSTLVSGHRRVGGMVGISISSKILNCHNTAHVFGKSCIGGLIGGQEDSTMSHCSSSGYVEGTEYNDTLGGLAGYNYGIIENCSFLGLVAGRAIAGGLVGSDGGTIISSHSSGKVTGEHIIGGLVGQKYIGAAFNCSSDCIIYGEGDVGGLMGTIWDAELYECSAEGPVHGKNRTGGLVGDAVPYGAVGKINGCRSTSNVQGRNGVGGLLGRSWYAVINNSYSTGHIKGSKKVGGGIGEAISTTMNNCYSTGYVDTGPYDGGGLVASNDETVCNSCFWDTGGSGWTYSEGGEGRTTDEMLDIQTYLGTDWELQHIWNMVDNRTYPFLRWESNHAPSIMEEGTIYFEEDSLNSFECRCSDPDPTDIRIRLYFTSDLKCLSFDENIGILTGAPGNEDVGSHWVNISAEDGRGASDYSNLTLVVNNTNDDPEIITNPITEIKEDEPFFQRLQAIDEDPTSDVLDWSLTTNASFLELNRENSSISGTADNFDVGFYWCNISVTDGRGGSTWKNYTFTVEDVNDPPGMITDILPDARYDEPYSVTVEADDIDLTEDELLFSMRTDLIFIELDPLTGELSGVPNIEDIGKHWIAIEVSDGRGGSDQRNYTINVTGINMAPVSRIDHIELQGYEDEEIVCDLRGIFSDPNGDTLELDHLPDNSFQITIDDEIATIVPQQDWSGTKVLTFTASDGEFQAELDATITIVQVPDPPVIEDIQYEKTWSFKTFIFSR